MWIVVPIFHFYVFLISICCNIAAGERRGKYKLRKLSDRFFAAVGGKEKIFQSNMVCMTRLRVNRRSCKVGSEALKAIDGVMGLVEDARVP